MSRMMLCKCRNAGRKIVAEFVSRDKWPVKTYETKEMYITESVVQEPLRCRRCRRRNMPVKVFKGRVSTSGGP
jgi:hypothetical protein